MAKDKGQCGTGPAIGGGVLGAVAGAVAGGIIAGPLGAIAGGFMGAAAGGLAGMLFGLLGCFLQEFFGGSGGSKPTWDFAKPRFTNLELKSDKNQVKVGNTCTVTVQTSVAGNDDNANIKVTYNFTAEAGTPGTQESSFPHNASTFSRVSPPFMPSWSEEHDERKVYAFVTLTATKGNQSYTITQNTNQAGITIVP